MVVRAVRISLVLAGLAVVALPALAQDAEEEDPVSFTLDAGFAATSGNTEVTTVTAGQTLGYQAGKFLFSQGFDMLFNRTDGATTAETYLGNVRGDLALGQAERFAVFLDLRASRNRFAGIARRFEQALGVRYDLIRARKDVVSLEGAGTAVQQRGTNGLDRNFPAALVSARWVHNFSETANLKIRGQYIPNLEQSNDYRAIGEAKLAAPISTKIAITLSYLVRYDNQPEPGFGTTDRFFTSGIQLTL